MPDITLQFNRADYPSLQVGDFAYYSTMTSTTDDDTGVTTIDNVGGFNISTTSATKMGPVKSIDNTTSLADGTLTTSITVDMFESINEPTTENFVFFRKDDTANMSSLLGYYSIATFINNSRSYAEMFAASCEMNESSK